MKETHTSRIIKINLKSINWQQIKGKASLNLKHERLSTITIEINYSKLLSIQEYTPFLVFIVVKYIHHE